MVVVFIYPSLMTFLIKYVWLCPIQSNSDVTSIFLAFLTHVTNFFSLKIASIQIDWEGEFRPLHKIFQTTGINHRVTYPYSHVQNGIVE